MFDSAGSERPKNFAPYAGLISATLTAISVCQLPVARFSSWGAVLGFAVMLVFLVFLAAFVSHLGFYRRNRTSSREASWNAAARGAVTTLWLAPLVLLVRENSPWALPATAIFVATLGVSLRTESDRFEPLAQTSLSFTNELEAFRLLEFPNGFRPAFAFGAVLCAEAGAFAAMVDHILAGALLVAIGSAAWAYTFRDTLARFSDETDAIVSRGVRTGSLAILITAVALLPFLIRGHGSSGSHFAGSQSSQKRSQPPRGVGDSDRDAYVGIVLWPKQEVTKLVAPRISVDKGASGHSRPFVIPFAGVYWFFKAPSVSLPPEPRQAHGSPEMFNIQSTDRRALSMEAHQNLGSLVALSCCHDIRIRIRNADRYPGTVSVELVLINTTVPGRPSLSLGRKSVRSTRPWTLYDQRPPATETLDYPLPQSSRMQRFDEVTVVFWLEQDRSFAAAKIGIEEFVLVPRA